MRSPTREKEYSVLSVSGVVGGAWELVKARPGPVVLLVVLSVVAELAIQMMMSPIEAPVTDFFAGLFRGVPFLPLAELREGAAALVASLLIYPLTLVLSSYVAVGILRGLIDIVRGQPLRPERLIKVSALTWAQMVALQFILFIAFTLGYVLLFVPGVILTLGMTVAGIVLVDEDTDALQAMSTSWELMRGAKLQMFKINACMTILTFGGMLLCLVGMIPVLMVWALVPVVVYEHLRQEQAQAPEPPAPIEPYPNIES